MLEIRNLFTVRLEWSSPASRSNNRQTGNAEKRLQSRLLIDLNRSNFVVYWLLVVVALPSLTQTSDTMPPVIIEGPPVDEICHHTKITKLPCTANGTLPMTYEWYRNGEFLEPNPDLKIKIEHDGSLSLNQPDEGFYQCRVENNAGVAVSNITHLQAAVIDDGNRRQITHYINGNEFQPLLRRCDHIIRSVPPARISWQYSDYEETPVTLNDRVVVTDDGSLVFTSLFPNDSNHDNSSFYKCVAHNSITKRDIRGSYFNLKVNEAGAGSQRPPPQLIYSSNDTVRVLEGQPFNLSCIFGGVDASGAVWQLPNKTTTSPTWKLNLPNAEPSDEGVYTCSVTGGRNTRHTKVIKVIVDALPRLETPLQGQRVQRGSSAHFTCQGVGRPMPTVSWIINGTVYNRTEYNGTQFAEFQHQGSDGYHGHSLVLHDVQRSASIECNVTNKYGYHLSSSYLIVGATTTSSQSQSSLWSPSSGSTSMRKGEGSSTLATLKTLSNTRMVELVTASNTVSPDYGKFDQNEQKTGSYSDSAEFKISILVPVVIIIVIVVSLIIVSSYLLYRRRKKKQSYSLGANDSDMRELKADYIREQEANTCDSDDSGYDDYGRKQSAVSKLAKRLSDTPEEETHL